MKFKAIALATAITFAVAGCNPSSTTPTTFTLAQAQAESTELLTALTAIEVEGAASGSIDAATKAKIDQILAGLSTANNSFQSAVAGQSFTTSAEQVIKFAQMILPLLPIPSTITTAINLGLAVIGSVINNVPLRVSSPMLTVKAPVAVTSSKVVAPVHIPTSY